MKSQHFQLLAKSGYLGLMLLIPLWHLWLSPPLSGLNPWLLTSFYLLPLLLPLKGILLGNPYTYAWSSFLALLYLVHSCVILMSSSAAEALLAAVELILTLLFLIGNIYFARLKGKEMGLGIRKSNKR